MRSPLRPAGLLLGLAHLAFLALVAVRPGAAHAQAGTPLLSDDLAANKRTRIDADGDGLDSLFGGGGSGFSTRKLEAIEDRLRADLRRERPRATPRLVVFLYPGKVSVERLRALREVLVDMELLMDPCDRSVCREEVGRHIEMVGRAVGSDTIATQDYKVLFKNLRLHTSTEMHGKVVESYLVPMPECIAAGKRRGGGMEWLEARAKADTDYEPLLVQAITRNARGRRLDLDGVPSVQRGGKSVAVALKLHGDRVRYNQQLVDALWAIGTALRASPATPPEAKIEVTIDTAQRGVAPKRFRTTGAPVLQFLDGKINAETLSSAYVEAVREGKDAPVRLDFDDNDAAGREPAAGAGGADRPPDDNQALAVLAQNFPALSACARTELARDPKFRGVTVQFDWLPSGRAAKVQTKEPALRGGPLSKCLESALVAMPLPRFAGTPRAIEYPIAVR